MSLQQVAAAPPASSFVLPAADGSEWRARWRVRQPKPPDREARSRADLTGAELTRGASR
jgi:hypothetical protein